MSLFDELSITKSEGAEGTGHPYLILRASVSYFKRGGSIVREESLKPVVRWSDPNMLRQWEEDCSMVGLTEFYESMSIKNNIEHHSLFKAHINSFRDWETGMIDDWHWELVLIPPEDAKEYMVSHPKWVGNLREYRRTEKQTEDKEVIEVSEGYVEPEY
jgi:hypothetical protein